MSITVDAFLKLRQLPVRMWLRPQSVMLFLVSLLLSLPVLVIAGSLLLPSGGVWQHLISTVLREYIGNSMLMMLGTGALSTIIGIIPAWLVTMYRFPLSWTFVWALLLPLAIPAYIIAYTYTGLLDTSGTLQNWIREITGWHFGEYWFPQIRSLGGAITMLSLVLYPYIYLIMRAAFIEQSICVLEVARTLGCGPYRIFFQVALPLARPAIMVGLTLVLMETLSDYGTVQYFGVATFTTGIFRTWFGLGSSVAAAQLSALLMLMMLLLIVVEYWSRKQQRFHHTSTRYRAIRQKRLRGWMAVSAIIVCALPVLLGFIIPAIFLLRMSLLTFAQVVDQHFYTLMWHSILLAGCAATGAAVLALFMAYGKRYAAGPLSRFAVNLSAMGYAIPGAVLAVGVMLPLAWLDRMVNELFRSYAGMSTGLLLSGTLFAVFFAYMVRFLAVSLRTVDAGFARIKPSMDEAGRSMGMRTISLISKVHIPMLRGSLLTAALLVFVDVLKELPATLVLRPFNFNTLAIRAYELANEERLADAACPSLAIVLAGIIPVIILSRSISVSRPGHEQGA